MNLEKQDPIKKGSFRTLLNRDLANWVIRAINSFLGLRVGRGLLLKWSDNGPLIELKDPQGGTGVLGGEEIEVVVCSNGTEVTYAIQGRIVT